MSGWKLNAEGDLDLSSGSLEIVTGAEAALQRIRGAFLLTLAEWFLDTRQGVPWYQVVLVRNPDLAVIGELFRQVILRDSAVDSLIDYSQNLGSDRRLSVSFAARLVDGEIIDIRETQPLIFNFEGTGGGN